MHIFYCIFVQFMQFPAHDFWVRPLCFSALQLLEWSSAEYIYMACKSTNIEVIFEGEASVLMCFLNTELWSSLLCKHRYGEGGPPSGTQFRKSHSRSIHKVIYLLNQYTCCKELLLYFHSVMLFMLNLHTCKRYT